MVFVIQNKGDGHHSDNRAPFVIIPGTSFFYRKDLGMDDTTRAYAILLGPEEGILWKGIRRKAIPSIRKTISCSPLNEQDNPPLLSESFY
jgi:hypothetical protein